MLPRGIRQRVIPCQRGKPARLSLLIGQRKKSLLRRAVIRLLARAEKPREIGATSNMPPRAITTAIVPNFLTPTPANNLKELAASLTKNLT